MTQELCENCGKVQKKSSAYRDLMNGFKDMVKLNSHMGSAIGALEFYGGKFEVTRYFREAGKDPKTFVREFTEIGKKILALRRIYMKALTAMEKDDF